MKALAETVSDDEMELDGPNGHPGKTRNKGKGKALSEEDEEDDEDDEDGADMEEVVVCTLDPQKVCSRQIIDVASQGSREVDYVFRTTNSLLT